MMACCCGRPGWHQATKKETVEWLESWKEELQRELREIQREIERMKKRKT
jgi:hypothetical protein